MPTPMVSFRLDPKIASIMDARCEALGQTRAEWLRGLIVGEVGSLDSADSDGGGKTVAGSDRFATFGEVDQRIDDLIGRLEPWIEHFETVATGLGDRLDRLEKAGRNRVVYSAGIEQLMRQ
jgi:hypothetical protein